MNAFGGLWSAPLHKGRGAAALLSLGLVLSACPPSPPSGDSGQMDASAADGARGLVRWATRSCFADGGCGPRRNHLSNSAINGVAPSSALQCTVRRTGDGASLQLALSFRASETADPTGSPGSLEVRGGMGALTGAVAPAMPITDCTINLREGDLALVGSCGGCTVTLANYFADTNTVQGNLRCPGLAGDGGTPGTQILNVDGMPGMNADFAITGCDVAP